MHYDLILPGVWTRRDLPDGFEFVEFGGEGRAWVRSAVHPGTTARAELEALRAEIQRAGADVRAVGDALIGEGADGWLLYYAVRVVGPVVVRLGWHDRSGLDLATFAEAGAAMSASLDLGGLEASVAALGARYARPVDPARLVPWPAWEPDPALLDGTEVRLGNGLHVLLAEAGPGFVRVVAPTDPLFARASRQTLSTVATMNLARELAGHALLRPCERDGVRWLDVGPHGLAPAFVCLPDARALAREWLGDVDPVALFVDRSTTRIVPPDLAEGAGGWAPPLALLRPARRPG